MIASRFWYGIIALLLGGATMMLYLTISMHDRLGMRSVSEGLSGDSQVVSWYLKQSAREGAAQLIRFSASDTVARSLAKAGGSDDVPSGTRRKVQSTLERLAKEIPEGQRFDAVFAVSQTGEVVAHVGFDQARKLEKFELGGYPVVADALHGYIRDDTLVLDRLYRVVARPVQFELGGMPVGAIVGATVVDDDFARGLSERTGAAVAFYTKGRRHALGVPDGFDRSGLDQIVTDLPSLDQDEDYQQKGRTNVHPFADGLAVVYARLPGEAWQLGAGFAVARQTPRLGGLLSVLSHADRKDREAVNTLLVIAIVVVAAAGGIGLSFLEFSRPLAVFRAQLSEVSSGATRHFQVERLRGPFRQVGLDVNLALDRASGGHDEDGPISVGFEQVFGAAAEPAGMSAFGMPDSSPPGSAAQPFGAVVAAAPEPPSHAQPVAEAFPAAFPAVAAAGGAGESAFQPPGFPAPTGPVAGAGYPPPRASSRQDAHAAAFGEAFAPEPPAIPAAAAPRRPPAPRAAASNGAADVEPGWQDVYEDFVRIKRDCGEAVEGFTFERFSATLRKNRDTLMQQHGVQRVHFSAYMKAGRAALKAKPVRE